jgi:elongator complex protein 3
MGKEKHREQNWEDSHEYSEEELELARQALEEIEDGSEVFKAIRRHPLPDGAGFLSKHTLITAYRQQVARGEREKSRQLLAKIRVKPTRTLSGVTTVTVLTKPYPCPGECIFCPNCVEMPVSYLPDEPGAMRALHHDFDPYDQVTARIQALYEIGHPTDKIELLILGGSWNAYPDSYQTWFLLQCFEALNGEPSETLPEAYRRNETAEHRNVGLVVETRPDLITRRTLRQMREMGITKVQLGVQSLDDEILRRNKRGHTVQQTRQAVALLRAAGFKIVLHWMPNLLGATIESDKADFERLWAWLAPDELKIYPTQLLENTELYTCWERGEYTPYTTRELIDLIADVKPDIPRYCRVNRIVRDIPSDNVVEGNKRTSLRQDIHRELDARGQRCECIRCREVRGESIEPDALTLQDLTYTANGAEEHFLMYNTPNDKLAGFLRLSLPGDALPETGLKDLERAALIREVHVYGQSIRLGKEIEGAAQHAGLGTQLLEKAETIAQESGYPRLAVISAVGTRQYYLDRDYHRGEFYLVKKL